MSVFFVLAKKLTTQGKLIINKALKRDMINEQDTMQEDNLETQEQATEVQEELVELSKEEQLANDLVAAQDKYARLFAEFDNYKKRTSRERVELIQSAGKEVIKKMLPVLDDFDRALQAMESTQDVEGVKQGIDLVNNKFRKTLVQEGLQEMENLIGNPFDAEFQEAITAIPAPKEELKNKVIDVVEKGYYLNDKVIRFAKVIIGQ